MKETSSRVSKKYDSHEIDALMNWINLNYGVYSLERRALNSKTEIQKNDRCSNKLIPLLLPIT